MKNISEDEKLIAAAKEDLEAFGTLYSKYHIDVFRYIHRRTSDFALAEDLTSNTFLKAFLNIQRYCWRQIPFIAWLRRIAENEVRLHLRKHRQVSRSNTELNSPVVPESISSSVEYAAVHKAILEMKPIHQTVIVLRFFEERAIKEIADIIGEKEGTVKSRLHYGLKQLRKTLTKRGIM